MSDNIQVRIVTNENIADIDFQKAIFDLQQQIDGLSSHADNLDYYISVASGVLCAMLDILWVGDFDLADGRNISDETVSEFVKKVAKVFGCKDGDLKKSVAFLEKMFPIPSDGNTADFGGALQHHLRDFAHHPTATGLMFSLLTQFTEKSYGTDTMGNFIIVPVPEKSKIFIGEDVPDKIMKGTIIWFFHLVSDIAGSSSSAEISGGTGIPGPILSMAKEFATLSFARDLKVNDGSLSQFLSKAFNGTLFAKRDENGKIIKDSIVKLDLRGEMGAIIQVGKQAIPVIANECIVRTFYFIRRFLSELKLKRVKTIKGLACVEWDKIKPCDSTTLNRMLTISTGVFTAVDVSEAVLTEKYWISVNYVGVGRFTIALGAETLSFLEIRRVKSIKKMYEELDRNTFTKSDREVYLAEGFDLEKFALTLEQIEILYNLEYHKTLNDIEKTSIPIVDEKIVALKKEWLENWRGFMSKGFPEFVKIKDAELHWFSKEELIEKVKSLEPEKPWLRFVLFEAMLFEPYFSLDVETDKNGKQVPSKKYLALKNSVSGYKEGEGDRYLDLIFNGEFNTEGYIVRVRKYHNKVMRELKEYLKSIIAGASVAVSIAAATIATAGTYAPMIAVSLVGTSFPTLSGAALTSACLAYLGGGAIAAGGLGMAGGTMAIVGGSAVLSVGVGASVGKGIVSYSMPDEKQTLIQSAKLMVSIKEIFLHDERDLEYAKAVFEQYVQRISDLEKELVDLKLTLDIAKKEDKNHLKTEIKNAEEAIGVMKIAMKSMNKVIGEFE